MQAPEKAPLPLPLTPFHPSQVKDRLPPRVASAHRLSDLRPPRVEIDSTEPTALPSQRAPPTPTETEGAAPGFPTSPTSPPLSPLSPSAHLKEGWCNLNPVPYSTA